MKTHYLKTWPEYFNAVVSGEKTFEVRKNDRDFQVGDILILMYYDTRLVAPKFNDVIPPEAVAKQVSYILYGGQFGIEDGYCVMGLKDV